MMRQASKRRERRCKQGGRASHRFERLAGEEPVELELHSEEYRYRASQQPQLEGRGATSGSQGDRIGRVAAMPDDERPIDDTEQSVDDLAAQLASTPGGAASEHPCTSHDRFIIRI